MIYYIASFPRSGNQWVMALIQNQFGCLCSTIYNDNPLDNKKVRKFTNLLNRFEYELVPAPEETLTSAELQPYLLYYRRNAIDPDVCVPLLERGVKEILSDEVRQELASNRHSFFLKTHELPFADYFPGEKVLQPVRHPGASLWSYYNFAHYVEKLNPTLDQIIKGKHWFGHWSRYHLAWLDCSRRLKENYRRVRFEDLINRELEFCRFLEPFLGCPILSTEIETFDSLHARRPLLARAGKAGGWEENYSQAQLKLLWREHGKVAACFGYAAPDYKKGAAQEIY
jgi:hypothetical protein